jgi:Holliday junction resolvase RusA-like endonuclease
MRPVTTEAVKIWVPVPPSVNGLFANSAKGGRHRSKSYEKWRALAMQEVMAQRPRRVAGKVRLSIRVERQSILADVTNRIKAAEDVLVTMQIIEDDKLVESCYIEWADDLDGCEIVVTPFI